MKKLNKCLIVKYLKLKLLLWIPKTEYIVYNTVDEVSK